MRGSAAKRLCWNAAGLSEKYSTVAFLRMNEAAGHNIHQGSHSNLRIKIQDFFRTWDTKKSAPIFVPFRESAYEFDSKQDTDVQN